MAGDKYLVNKKVTVLIRCRFGFNLREKMTLYRKVGTKIRSGESIFFSTIKE